jgi:hypothetical protein
LENPDKYLTREVFDITYSNSEVDKKMSLARKEEHSYTTSLLEPRSSIKMNIEKITYEAILDFYKTSGFDKAESWTYWDAKSIREQE